MAKSPTAEMTCAEGTQRAKPKYSLPEIYELLFKELPEPPAQLTRITVKRNAKGIPVDLAVEMVGWKTLKPNEQVVWVCPDGRLEIRFDAALSPFAGANFEVPRGARVFSGLPDPKRLTMRSFKYTVLVTTPDGFFLKKDADVVIERGSTGQK